MLLTLRFCLLLLFHGVLLCPFILVLLAFVSHCFPPLFCPRLRVPKPSAAFGEYKRNANIRPFPTVQLCPFFVNRGPGRLVSRKPEKASKAAIRKAEAADLLFASFRSARCAAHLVQFDEGDSASGDLRQHPVPFLDAFVLNEDRADRP